MLEFIIEQGKLLKEKCYPQRLSPGLLCRLFNNNSIIFKSITEKDIDNPFIIIEEVYPNIQSILDWLKDYQNIYITTEKNSDMWEYKIKIGGIGNKIFTSTEKYTNSSKAILGGINNVLKYWI